MACFYILEVVCWACFAPHLVIFSTSSSIQKIWFDRAISEAKFKINFVLPLLHVDYSNSSCSQRELIFNAQKMMQLYSKKNIFLGKNGRKQISATVKQ